MDFRVFILLSFVTVTWLCFWGIFSFGATATNLCQDVAQMFFRLFRADFLLGSGWISQVWISALDLSNAGVWGFGGFHLCSLAIMWGSYHSCLFYIIRVWFTNHLHLLLLHVTIAAQSSDQSELEGFAEMSSCKMVWSSVVVWDVFRVSWIFHKSFAFTSVTCHNCCQSSDQSELEGFVEMNSCKIWCEEVRWCKMYLWFHEYLLLFNVMLSIMVVLSI